MTNEQKRKAEILEQYGIICKYISVLQKTIDKYSELKCANLLIAELKAMQEKRTNVYNAVNAVSDEELRTILTYRYIDGITREQTAEALYMHDRTIARKTLKALEAVEL